MLGEREDDITIKSLRAGASSEGGDGEVQVELKSFNKGSMGATAGKKSLTKMSKTASEVVLPAAAAAKARPSSAGKATLGKDDFHNSVPRVYSERPKLPSRGKKIGYGADE